MMLTTMKIVTELWFCSLIYLSRAYQDLVVTLTYITNKVNVLLCDLAPLLQAARMPDLATQSSMTCLYLELRESRLPASCGRVIHATPYPSFYTSL